MSERVFGASCVWLDPSPLGEYCIVELLPMRRIWEDLRKSRHRSRKPTFPSCDVDQVFSQTPLAPRLAKKVLSGFDRQAQVGEHAVEPSAAVAQKMEEWLALHAATVSKKACGVQASCDLQILAGDWRLMTGDFRGLTPTFVA